MVLLLIKNMLEAQESHSAVNDLGLEDRRHLVDAQSFYVNYQAQVDQLDDNYSIYNDSFLEVVTESMQIGDETGNQHARWIPKELVLSHCDEF